MYLQKIQRIENNGCFVFYLESGSLNFQLLFYPPINLQILLHLGVSLTLQDDILYKADPDLEPDFQKKRTTDL